MTLDELLEKERLLLNDPQPGMVAGGRDQPTRKVTGRFMGFDAGCNSTDLQPYVIYTVEHRVPLRCWRRWFRYTGAGVQ